MNLDDYDRKLLSALQKDSSQTTSQLSKEVNLSGSQCSRRKAALEETGIIETYTARLSARKLGLTFKAIARINLKAHGEQTDQDFVRFLEKHPIVCEAYSVSGDADYILEILTSSLDDFADFVHRHLLPHPQVAQVRSDIVLRTLKSDCGLPI